MKIIYKIHIAALMAATLSAMGSAQELSKEITVDHDIVPEMREASKLGFLPVVELDPVRRVMLDISSQGIPVGLTPKITTLAPAAYGDSLEVSPWRGYAALGYFPAYNLGASAGYRFIDNDRTRLGAWLQYDGNTYKVSPKWLSHYPSTGLDKLRVNHNAVNVGVSLHQSVGVNSFVEANVGYGFDRHSNFNPRSDYDLIDKTINRFNIDAAWTSKRAATLLWARAGYGLFKNSMANERGILDGDAIMGTIGKSVGENKIFVGGGAQRLTSEVSKIMAEASLSVLSNSGMEREDFSHGLLTLKPGYSYKNDNFQATLGAKAELTFNSGKAFHIAPDVAVAWRPVKMLGVEARAGGGEWQNSQMSVYSVSPYVNGYYAYRNSHLPITFDAKICLGPFKGTQLEFYGAYAVANDWLMPVRHSNILQFYALDFRGAMVGASLSYNDGRWGNAKVCFEATPSRSYTRGWYLWRDRAKNVMRAEANVIPITPLEINIMWELRTGRHMEYSDLDLANPAELVVNRYYESLSTLANLSAGASWRFNPRLGVFLRGENILGRSYFLIGSMPARGAHGLAGVTYKF